MRPVGSWGVSKDGEDASPQKHVLPTGEELMDTQLVPITRTTACSDCWKLWAPNYRLQGCTSCRLATQPSAKPTSDA